MDFELTKLIIPAFVGLIAGAIGSLIAPWIHWRIEKKRKSIEYKQSLIKEARHLVDSSDSIEQILSSSLWGFISANLSKEEKSAVSDSRRIDLPAWPGLDALAGRKQAISVMLHRLEKEWNL